MNALVQVQVLVSYQLWFGLRTFFGPNSVHLLCCFGLFHIKKITLYIAHKKRK